MTTTAVKEPKEQKKGSTSELANLFPAISVITVKVKRVSGEGADRVITWEERQVTVEPLVIEQLGRVASALEPIAETIARAPNFLALAIQHPEPIFAAVAQAIEWPVSDVRMIYGADFVTMTGKLIETNKDFFTRLLGPLVGALLATAVTRPGSGVSPTDSGSSASTDTPIQSATH